MVTGGRLWLRLARTRQAGWVLRGLFARMSFLIPAQRLYETETLVAFYHPRPAYAVHVLIVPKRAYRSMMDVAPDDAPFLRDLVQAVQALVKTLELEKKGFRLITNGGKYQDVSVLHFHLISD